jgi:hypothetical protein
LSARVIEVAAWSPQPARRPGGQAPQRDAISCPLPDLFYGGARGGGKSDFLLGDFLIREARYGKITGLLCRRTYKALGDLIERSKEIYAPLGWKFHSGIDQLYWESPRGSILRFRHLETLADADLYQGFNNQWLGFDEVEQWADPRPLDRLFATLRSTRGVPCVRRCGGNPGGAGHSWLKKRYRPDLWHEGEPYVHTRYRPQPEELPGLWVDAVFIPAKIEDNAYLPPEYEANIAIAAGTPQLFRAWRHGDWDVVSGAYFDIFDLARHVRDPRQIVIEPWDVRWISGDWGFNDETAIYWHSINADRHVVTYREWVTNKTIAPDIGRGIVERSRLGTSEPPRYERFASFPFSPDAFKPGAERTIADEIGDVLRDAGLPAPVKAIDDRVSGWQLLYQLLATDNWTISTACPYLIESLPLMLRDEGKVNDIAPHPMDHGPDGARYGLKTFLTPADEPDEVKIARAVTAPLDQPTDRMLQRLTAEKRINTPAPQRVNRRRFF